MFFGWRATIWYIAGEKSWRVWLCPLINIYTYDSYMFVYKMKTFWLVNCNQWDCPHPRNWWFWYWCLFGCSTCHNEEYTQKDNFLVSTYSLFFFREGQVCWDRITSILKHFVTRLFLKAYSNGKLTSSKPDPSHKCFGSSLLEPVCVRAALEGFVLLLLLPHCSCEGRHDPSDLKSPLS